MHILNQSDKVIPIKIIRKEGMNVWWKPDGICHCCNKSGSYAGAACPNIMNSAEHLSRRTIFSCLHQLRWTYIVLCFHTSFGTFLIHHSRFGSTKSLITMRYHLKRALAENKILRSKNLHWTETFKNHPQIVHGPWVRRPWFRIHVILFIRKHGIENLLNNAYLSQTITQGSLRKEHQYVKKVFDAGREAHVLCIPIGELIYSFKHILSKETQKSPQTLKIVRLYPDAYWKLPSVFFGLYNIYFNTWSPTDAFNAYNNRSS